MQNIREVQKKGGKDAGIDLSELFPAGEHGIYAYYGRIGQGKTYAMTADVLSALRNGRVVYTNYPIDWSGFDERFSFSHLFVSLFGLKNRFYEFYRDNLKHIEIDEHFHDRLGELTDCIVALDEGYVVMDSYEMAKMSMKKRKNVLHTRHFDRSIWYTTQRPNAVHVTLRAQTNVFYKITKIITWPFILFRRQEFDLGSDDGVDETRPFSVKYYLGQQAIFEAFNTKYLRYGARQSQEIAVGVHRLGYFGRWSNFISNVMIFLGLKAEKDPPKGDNSTITALKKAVGSTLQTSSDSKSIDINQLDLPF